MLVYSVLLYSDKLGLPIGIVPRYDGNPLVDATRAMVRRQWLTKRKVDI